jgi:hypothetical protein
MREKVEDAQVHRKTLINAFRDFLNQVLPDAKTKASISPKLEKLHTATQSSPLRPLSSPATPGFRGFSEEVIYETPTGPLDPKAEGTEEVLDFNTRNFGALASPYVSPYVYKK